jgi:hypothetical protein
MAWRSGTGAATASATVGWTSSVRGGGQTKRCGRKYEPSGNLPDGFMILQLLKAFGCRDTIQFGTLRLILGDILCPSTI